MTRHKEASSYKRLKGSDARYINDHAPQFDGIPIMPDGLLGPDGKRHWGDLAPKLINLGLLTDADTGTFLGLCQSYELMVMAWRRLKREGLFRKDENNVLRKHPALQLWRDAYVQYLKAAIQFGLTPSAVKD